MLGGTVRMGDRQPVFHGQTRRIVILRVVDFLVDNGLNRRILRCLNLKAAAEQEIGGLCVGVAEFFLQSVCDLLNQLVRIIRIRCGAFFDGKIHILDT